MAIPLMRLSSGSYIPVLGFGTWDDEKEPGKCYKSVKAALESGYRHIDTAAFYQCEMEVGEAIEDFLRSHPKSTRQDLFITSKVWNQNHEPSDVKDSLSKTLKDLRLDYVDLFLVHWPVATKKGEDGSPLRDSDGKVIINEHLTEHQEITWRAMEEVYDAGLAKSIGVSNWTIDRLQALLKHARIRPTVNQVEIHPFLPNTALLEYCTREGIVLEAYSPLGKMSVAKKLAEVPTLSKLIDESGASLPQVLIAWGVQRGYVVLVKSYTPSRIKENLQLVKLDQRIMQAIEDAVAGQKIRFVSLEEQGYPIDVWADSE